MNHPHGAAGREVRRALVTGCAGFIGSHLTEALLNAGVAVIGVDCFNDNYQRGPKLRNLSHQAKDWDEFEFVPIDLAHGDLADIVAGVDTVFHLAAEPGVRASWGARFERYLQNNVYATQQLLEAARTSPETRLVFASSSSIYGDAERLPTPEDALPLPVSPYGVTKLAAEHLCRLYCVNHGLDVVRLRYFTVYGPRQRPDMAFHRFITAALAGEPIIVYGDGTQTRDFTFVADIVAGTLAAARRPTAVCGVYNLGGGSRTSIRKVLDLIEGIAGRPLEVRWAATEHGDVRHTAAQTDHARKDLAFAPETRLADGLAAQLEWVAHTRDGPRATGT